MREILLSKGTTYIPLNPYRILTIVKRVHTIHALIGITVLETREAPKEGLSSER